MKRPGIGWAVAAMVFGLFVFGILWAAFYYGVIQPIETAMTGSFSNAFGASDLLFMNTVVAWWPFIILLGYLVWLWGKSNKQGLGQY